MFWLFLIGFVAGIIARLATIALAATLRRRGWSWRRRDGESAEWFIRRWRSDETRLLFVLAIGRRPRWQFGATLSQDDDGEWHLHLACVWSLFLAFDDSRWIGGASHPREWGAMLSGDFLRLWWACDDCELRYSERGTPIPLHGFYRSWFILDHLLGQRDFRRTVLEEGRYPLALPEREYLATYRVERRVWRRPRWPFPTTVLGYNVAFDPALPLPGKGENAYDCDDDAIYEQSGPLKGRTIGQVLLEIQTSVLDRRGPQWQPSGD